jgi:ankyrin repeat protein
MTRILPSSCPVVVAWWFVAGACLGPSALAQGPASDGLAVRFQLDGADGSRAINFDEPFTFELVNNSDTTLRIWNPETKEGYYQLSFQFKNLHSGETYSVRKRRIADEEFWTGRRGGAEPPTIEVAPKSSCTTQLRLREFDWGFDAWEGLPDPNSDDRFVVIVQFQSANPPDSTGSRVWTGKIQSSPTTARIIAPSLKTPHDYLQSGFSRAAIAMMSADPKWISAQDQSLCTPLHHAARYGRTDAVKWLLDRGANVNAIAYNGFTPLHLADDAGAIELILRKHPDLTIRCRANGQTPLQCAAANLVDPRRADEQEKWQRVVKMYLDNGAEYDLLTAIQLGDLARVKEILRKTPGCADDFQGESPVRTAAAVGRLEICRFLIEQHHVDVNDFKRGNGYPIIKEALPFPRVVELLIKSGADLKTRITWRGGRTGMWFVGDDATALHHAAVDGVPGTITILIDHGVDIFAMAHDLSGKETRQSALEVAARFGKADNANAIASHPEFDRANPRLRQEVLDKCLWTGASSPPAQAAQGPKLIKILLDEGANPNAAKNGVTAMQMAARTIHPNAEIRNAKIKQTIAFLRDHGAAVDLFSAVAIGDLDEVRRLLKVRPETAESRAPDGYPALHFAVAMNDKSIVVELLNAGCAVDLPNKSDRTGEPGGTPLGCAAFLGRYGIAQLLLNAGANVNALTNRKSTPLHEAACMGHVKIARLLLEKGANADARDDKNQTPLDWCHELKRKSTAEIDKLFHEHRVLKNK